MKTLIDIRNNPLVLDIINVIVNNGGIAEVKQEYKNGKENLVVVEIRRKVRTKDE